ncbi:MAG: protein kinase [Planctomycetes bacterium]|nr:protein kinase [Planctomycetota bacterium]
MGTVFAGENIETGEAAAIKIMSPSLAQEEGFRERFGAEIETLRKLRHRHIVRLLGFGEQDGHHFYAMELVEGTSLEDELHAGRRFDWREAARIAIQTCRALKHAHDRGVIHRDIKPANLLLTADGDVKLSDFGIAKLFGNTRMTAGGGLLGTAEYMAPEQADGRPVTHRCDLYSLGGVMYSLLAGRPPFRAKSLPEMLQLQRFAEAEPVRRYAAHVPAELEQVIAQLLAKDPEARIANAQVLSRRLEAIERALSVQPPANVAIPAPEERNGDSPRTPTADLEHRIAERQTVAQTPRPGVPPAEVHTAPTAVAAEAGVASLQQDSPSMASSKPTGSGHFTRVERSDCDPDDLLSDNSSTNLFSLQTLALVLTMLAFGAGAWYFLQPPSADALYARVDSRARGGDIERLLEAEDDIRAFLARHARDPRARTMEEYKAEIDLERLQRKLERRSRLALGAESLTPVERAYVDAIRYLRLDPERGREKLQSLVDVYHDRTAEGGPTEQCLELAQRQLEKLNDQVRDFAAESLALLESRLDAAEQLRQSDPQAARKIWEGIVELYREKSWAAPAVARARQALQGAL